MPEVESIDGEDIFYELLGEGDITLVFIGGLGAPTGRICWRNQLHLAEKYRLILIDLPGHGQSSKNREKYTMELYGQDIKKVIESINLDNNILIGWSLGGAAVLEAEVLMSERVLGIIPVESLFPNSLNTKLDEEVIKNIIKPYEEDFVGAYTNLIDSFLSEKFDQEEIDLLHTQTKTLDSRSIISALTELVRWDMYKVLPEVRTQIKSIIAERSTEHYPKEEYEKNLDAVYVKDVGHLLGFEDPVAFNEALVRVINEFL